MSVSTAKSSKSMTDPKIKAARPVATRQRAVAMPIALKYLGATIFILFAAPRMGYKVWSIPLYFIDFLLAMTAIKASKLSPLVSKKPFTLLILIILLLALASETLGAFYLGDVIKPFYTSIRTVLALSIFYSASQIVRTRRDLMFLFQCASLGLVITAGMMIISSIPPTRGIARAIFDIPFLEPISAESINNTFADSEAAKRGRSLVGVSILSGAFINIAWPFVLFLVKARAGGRNGKLKLIFLAGCVLGPLGVIASYSRGAILGLLLIVAAGLTLRSSSARSAIIGGIFCVGLLIFSVGAKSNLFFFERLEKRTDVILEGNFDDVRESERIDSYTQPIVHLMKNPKFFFVGAGTTYAKVGGISEDSGIVKGAADHAVFSRAYYSYGIIASLLYVLLVASGFLFLRRRIYAQDVGPRFERMISQVLFLSMVGMLPWFIFGHAAVSQPRGAMVFFLVFGLIAALPNLERSEMARRNRLTKRKRVKAHRLKKS